MAGDQNLERYSRQMRFPGLGMDGQRRLSRARATLCGCGALGTVIANGLVRAGIGSLRIVDRDVPELTNLQRQMLFDESDVAAGIPKAEAAASKLRRINSDVSIDAVVADLDHTNIDAYCGDADVILDGTDNFETRFLINDFAIKTGRPWIFGGCIGAEGQIMTIVPGETACLRCIIDAPPEPGSAPTCETAGILGPASSIVGSLQVAEAIKLLSGNAQAIQRGLTVIDVWENRFKVMNLEGLREASQCPVCVGRRFDWLDGKAASHSIELCGRNAVQVVPPRRGALDWESLVRQVQQIGNDVRVNASLIRFTIDAYEFSVFRDGRAIIKGTSDLSLARSLHARYIGC